MVILIHVITILSILIIISSEIKDLNLEQFFSKQIAKIINKTLEKNLFKKSDNIYNYLRMYYSNENSSSIKQLVKYSSKKKGDILFGNKCFELNNQEKNSIKYKYKLFSGFIKKENEIKISPPMKDLFLFGLCIVDNDTLNDDDYKKIIETINRECGYILGFIYVEVENDKIEEKNYFPFIVLIIIIILTIFRKFFIKIFNCKININITKYKIKNKKKEKNISKIIFKFFNIFNLSDNIAEFFSLEEKTKLFNDNGLIYIKGLRGIFIITQVFGTIFMILYIFPIYVNDSQKNYLKEINWYFPLIRFFILSSPRVLYALSGFTCSYKFYMFLDKRLKKQIEKRQQHYFRNKSLNILLNYKSLPYNLSYSGHNSKESINKDLEINMIEINSNNDKSINKENEDNYNNCLSATFIENKKFKNKEEENSESLKYLNDTFESMNWKREENQNDISFFYLLEFYFLQFHKIILSLLFISLIIISKGVFFDKQKNSPMMMILYNLHYKDKSFWEHIGHLFLYKDFDLYKIIINNFVCSINIFYLIYNEIFFFVCTLPILFIFYKKRIKIYYILYIILFLDSVKLLIYFFINFFDEDNSFLKGKGYKITNRFIIKFTFIDSYLKWPIFNWNYYLIGALFGLMQYSLQSLKVETYNGYLNLVVDFLYFLKRQSKKFYNIIEIISIIIIILFQFSQNIALSLLNQKEKYQLFYRTTFSIFDVLFLIEGNIITVLIFLIHFIKYIRGGSFLIYILSIPTSIIFNKIYFSFAMILEVITLWFFYQNDSNYQLVFFSYFYFGTIIMIILFLCSLVICVLFEIPLKKFFLFIIKKIKKKN